MGRQEQLESEQIDVFWCPDCDLYYALWQEELATDEPSCPNCANFSAQEYVGSGRVAFREWRAAEEG